MDWATTIGIIGVSGILCAYFLNLFNTISQESYTYLLINLFGASLACVSSILIKSIPFTILEAIWSLVSVIALVNKLRKAYSSKKPIKRHENLKNSRSTI